MALDFAFQKLMEQRLTAIRSLPPDKLIAEKDRLGLSITDVKQGGFMRVNGQVKHVQQAGRYDEWNDKFTKKLSGDFACVEFRVLNIETGERENFEWEIDDGELSVSATIARLKFSDLTDDEGEGIDDDDLEQIEEEEDDIFYQGKKFECDSDECWSAKYYPQDSRTGEKVYMYEFEAKDGSMITIEEWVQGDEKYEYQIWLSEPINPDSIEVIATGG